MRRAILILGATLAWLAFGQAACACSVCFGEPGSPMSRGLGWGVAVLLSVVFGVLGCFAAFFVYLVRRSNRPEVAVAESAAEKNEDLSVLPS